VPRDGEILIRKVRGPAAGNRFNYAIQVMEADHLDDRDFRQLDKGRQVTMGVETNEWNRPLGYHVFRGHPGNDFAGLDRFTTIRVPAKNMLHAFLTERAGQTRGLPWVVSAMLRLNMLGGYEEAELVAARVAAAKMGFFVSPDGEGFEGSGLDDDGNTLMDAEAGRLEQLPAGVDFKPWDPQHPNTAFPTFLKAMLRGVAASIGASYNTLSGDLEGVNFSSLRQGALNERDAWRTIQAWTVTALHAEIFADWLEMALTSPAGLALPLAKFDKFNSPTWHPRGWQWVDPQKEAAGNEKAIKNGLKTRTEVLAERGRTLEEVLEERQRENEMAAAFGVDLGTPQQDEGQQTDDDTGNDDDERE